MRKYIILIFIMISSLIIMGLTIYNRVEKPIYSSINVNRNYDGDRILMKCSLERVDTLIIGIFSLIFSLCFIYLVMKNKLEKFKLIYILGSIILSIFITYLTIYVSNNYVLKDIDEKISRSVIYSSNE